MVIFVSCFGPIGLGVYFGRCGNGAYFMFTVLTQDIAVIFVRLSNQTKCHRAIALVFLFLSSVLVVKLDYRFWRPKLPRYFLFLPNFRLRSFNRCAHYCMVLVRRFFCPVGEKIFLVKVKSCGVFNPSGACPDSNTIILCVRFFKTHFESSKTKGQRRKTQWNLWIAQGKKKAVVYDFIEHVGSEWMENVQAVACDMNSDFKEAFEEKYPHIEICTLRALKKCKYIISSTAKSRKQIDKQANEEKIKHKGSQLFGAATIPCKGSGKNAIRT